MAGRPALFTEADLRRAMRAAKKEGWKTVTVQTKDGVTITLGEEATEKPLEEKPEIIL